jgi:hypothetical protein
MGKNGTTLKRSAYVEQVNPIVSIMVLVFSVQNLHFGKSSKQNVIDVQQALFLIKL